MSESIVFRDEDVSRVLLAYGVVVTPATVSRVEALNRVWGAEALEPWQSRALLLLCVKLAPCVATMSMASLRELVLGELDASLDAHEHVRMAHRRQRLKDLCDQTADVCTASRSDDVQSIEAFFAAVPAWSPAAAAASADKCVIPLATDRGFLIQRTLPRNGCCYVQGAVVQLSYKICLNRLAAGLDVVPDACIDVTEHVLGRKSLDEVWDLVWSGSGGHVPTFLKRIGGLTGRGDVREYGLGAIAEQLETNNRWLVGMLRRHGPALVSLVQIEVEAEGGEVIDELISPRLSYSSWEKSAATSTVAHLSVLIIGWNVLASGKVWYLVQNWWGDKQFFEIDDEFLLTRDAHLTFITTDGLTEHPSTERIRRGVVFKSAAFGQPAECLRSLIK